MSKVKSFAVGSGDMFYINHNSDNFTVIDCCLDYDDESKSAKNRILDEISNESKWKTVSRFISTHPDEDHISGLKEYNERFGILNFYRVNNDSSKRGEESEDFIEYKTLRDDIRKSFELKKGCARKWMNEEDQERKSSGLHCLWPITDNDMYQMALETAANGGSPNNISPAIKYISDKYSFLWMGDMETSMQEEFDYNVVNEHVSIVFAPHHGRKTGHIPASLMDKLSPKLVVVGEADSDDLDYYSNQNTITQNTAGDILFEVKSGYIDVFVSNSSYTKTDGMFTRLSHETYAGMKYLGSIQE